MLDTRRITVDRAGNLSCLRGGRTAHAPGAKTIWHGRWVLPDYPATHLPARSPTCPPAPAECVPPPGCAYLLAPVVCCLHHLATHSHTCHGMFPRPRPPSRTGASVFPASRPSVGVVPPPARLPSTGVIPTPPRRAPPSRTAVGVFLPAEDARSAQVERGEVRELRRGAGRHRPPRHVRRPCRQTCRIHSCARRTKYNTHFNIHLYFPVLKSHQRVDGELFFQGFISGNCVRSWTVAKRMGRCAARTLCCAQFRGKKVPHTKAVNHQNCLLFFGLMFHGIMGTSRPRRQQKARPDPQSQPRPAPPCPAPPPCLTQPRPTCALLIGRTCEEAPGADALRRGRRAPHRRPRRPPQLLPRRRRRLPRRPRLVLPALGAKYGAPSERRVWDVVLHKECQKVKGYRTTAVRFQS